MDGNLAAELTARLLKAGFTAELAARLVNVALALKSDEESGATLDLISVDLYTGTARIFKAGAAPGFLVHGGRARPVGDISLPIGILGGVNGQSRVVHLAAGDYAYWSRTVCWWTAPAGWQSSWNSPPPQANRPTRWPGSLWRPPAPAPNRPADPMTSPPPCSG